MSRTLILMRHAKSSWGDFDMSDHDRVLNTRGRNAAKAMGKWLASNNYLPDQLLCSSANRTRETYALLGLDIAQESFREDLYHASSDRMMMVLQSARAQTVLLLGHNPGIGDFAARIAATTPRHPRFLDYPTCATTVVQFETDNWADISFGSGQLTQFVTPRDLQD